MWRLRVQIGTEGAAATRDPPQETFRRRTHYAHNHPSGDVTPSAEDLEVTKRLAEAGRVLGVTLLDHIVWTRSGAFQSLRASHPVLLSPKS